MKSIARTILAVAAIWTAITYTFVVGVGQMIEEDES